MGVHGLWRLLDATGKQVPLETLEGKVLAIDISIWIYQVMLGYQERFSNPKPNAHLIGLFNRICKLLYYKIKPVFVFDGGVPMLKKNTIALRRKQKSMAKNKALQMRTELINNLIKHSAVKTVLNPEEENVKNNSTQAILSSLNKQTTDDMFKLPDMPSTNPSELSPDDDYDSDSSTIELSPRKQTKWIGNIHNVDVGSTEFKALPPDVRYDILTDLKETRKQNSWGRLHEMPDESHQFSGYQMKRLLKRRLVQQSLESAEKEMGGKSLTLEELEKLLTEQGVDTANRNCNYRVAGDSETRLVYISDKNAYIKNISNNSKPNDQEVVADKDEAKEPVPGTSKDVPISENMNEYQLDDEWDSDVEITATTKSKSPAEESSNDSYFATEWKESRPPSKNCFGKHTINPALSYMLEYSGLTEAQIHTLLEQRSKEDGKGSRDTVKTSLQFDLFETKSGNSKDNEDSKDFTEVGTTGDIESVSISEVGFSESIVQSDDNLSPVTISKASKIESDVVTVISSTDSDSDFIEIADVPTVDFDSSKIKKSTSQAIEITLRSDQTIEDDMFADVFGAPNNESKTEEVEAMSENVSISSEPFEIVEQRSPDHSEILETAVLEKTIVETIKEKVQDPSDTTKTNDIETLQVTDNDTDNNNVQNVNTQLEDIEEADSTDDAYNSSQNNAEITLMDNNANTSAWITDPPNASPLPVNDDELLSLKARLEDEQSELVTNIGKLQRQGIDISKQVSSEAQELLRLFGIPYVVAPMEAEAQCAYLEQVCLTDGTITDDSDIWLFGGQCVYKNFFDSTKKVLRYRSCDIQHHFKLTRNELIRFALLVGSDYTTGLAGIGPVTALEILAAFPSEGDNLLQGLTSFRSWVAAGRATGPGKASLRTKLQNLQIQKGFPSEAVVQAYLVPKVDESKEAFTWGKPSTLLLSDYAKQKFGWTKEKFNEIMKPILKRLEEKQDQKFIDTYFKLQSAALKSIDVNLSKRVQKAVQRLNNPNMEDATESVESVKSAEITRQPLRKKRAITSTEARKKKKESADTRETTDSKAAESEVFNASVDKKNSLKDYIPQREKDKAEALKKKLHAIEVVRKSKQGLYKTKKVKRCVRKVKEEAGLSESDSNSS
ncbi:rad2 superfamily protein mus201 [Lasioglossum baleicum]|uniref:rad2 superfamily protein mus201 n=1 Tax=Lasioglossum baleicum TaxID=434251 RepID=UPI003FCC690A